jgi:centromere/kinetochore protein ZW10
MSEQVDLATILNSAGEDSPDRLQLYAKNIAESITQYKLDLYNTINENSEEFFGGLRFPASAEKSISKLDADFQSVNERVNHKTDGLDATVVEVLQKKAALQEGIKKKNDLISLLSKLKFIKQNLDNFDKYLSSKNIDKAAHVYHDMENTLSSIIKEFQFEAGSMPIILEKLEVQSQNKFALLKVKADEYFGQMLVKKENQLTISLLHDGLVLEQVIATLKDLNIWEDKSSHLFKLISAILREVTLLPNSSVKCANIENSRIVVEVEQGKTSTPAKRNSTSYKDRKLMSSKVSEHIQQTERLFTTLLSVLTFLKNEIYPRVELVSTDEQLRGFGRRILPDMFDQILKNFMTKMIPEHSNELVEYLAVIDKTVKFEEELDALGFSSASDPRVLSQFAKQVDRHFAKKKRRGILAEAREIIVHADHNTTTMQFSTEKGPIEGEYVANSSSGSSMDESVFALPKVQVSTTAVKLIDLADIVLQEACESTPACADNLYGATRDMFDMFRSLSMGCQGANLVNIPQLGLLFHNDCMYLAHHLLILSHRYKPKLPDPLNKKASFVDLAQDLRKLGLDYYYIQMNKQREMLVEHISSMQGLSDTHKEARAAQVELTYKKILHQLNLLQKVWKDILPSEMYNKSVGTLIDLVIEKMVFFVEELADISEKETHELHRLFKLLFPLENLLLPSVPSVSPATYIPRWGKFIIMTNLLEMSLVSIIEKWNASEMLDFKKYEVVQLIKALFSDSDFRRDQIAKMK